MDLKNIFNNVKNKIPKKNNNNAAQIMKPVNYYQDLINPYQIIFNPSFIEVNEDKMIDYLVLNDMSWQKSLNYLHPIFKYYKKNDLSLFFSPIDSSKILLDYKKELFKLRNKYNKDLEEGKDPDKKMAEMIKDYEELVNDLDTWNDGYLNYSILYSQEMNKSDSEEPYESMRENRTELRRFFFKWLQQPSKYYTPVWQLEEAYLSQQPLCEYRLKDWSNISAVSWMTLYPFFTETKDPSVTDWVPYWINRNTWEMLFFNHSKLYEDWYITNRNLNVFWGTGSWKTSFFRSQIPLRNSYWDHFILFDPKKDYVSFTKDLGWQNISFRIDEPMGYNFFYRPLDTYKKFEIIDWKKVAKDVDVQSIEEKKWNLLKIFSIMCPYLSEETDIAEFSKAILDSSLSKIYDKDPSWDSVNLQLFYDEYLNETIQYYVDKEPTKINSYTLAWERLKANLWFFVIKKDGSKWVYHKMFLPVDKDKEIKLKNTPIINFDLSWLFKDDLLFTIGCLIWLEFTWTQIATQDRKDRTIYVWIDENWKLLKYDKAWEYEENFSRLIRWLWGWLITMSQHLNEYTNSEYWQQVLAQAQTTIILKIEPNELLLLKERFPKWFTDEVIEDFDKINQSKDSYWIWYIYTRWRMQPFKYLYLPSRNWNDTWQEKSSWQHNMDSDEGFET